MAPEDNPADDVEPTEEEYDTAMREREAAPIEVHVNTRGCEPMQPETAEALARMFKAAHAQLSNGSLKEIDPDTEHYIACELTHDIRNMASEEQGLERVRWNNRAMAMAIKTIATLRRSAVASEVSGEKVAYDELLFARVKQLEEIDERLERLQVAHKDHCLTLLAILRRDIARMIEVARAEHDAF